MALKSGGKNFIKHKINNKEKKQITKDTFFETPFLYEIISKVKYFHKPSFFIKSLSICNVLSFLILMKKFLFKLF